MQQKTKQIQPEVDTGVSIMCNSRSNVGGSSLSPGQWGTTVFQTEAGAAALNSTILSLSGRVRVEIELLVAVGLEKLGL